MIAAMMQYGLSVLGTAYLVSVTFRVRSQDSGKPVSYVTAEYAERHWRELVRRLKRQSRFKNLATFRVVELTKQGQIHFHVLMGGITLDDAKWSCDLNPNWALIPKRGCTCLRCGLSAVWYNVTGDSWIVDVRKVGSREGAAWYLCKYLGKTLYGEGREAIAEVGYSRRYMASGNWPRGSQMRRRGTVEKKWVRTSWARGEGVMQHTLDKSRHHSLMEQMGTDLAKDFKLEKARKRLASLHETLRNGGRYSRK